jgi:MFS family permease
MIRKRLVFLTLTFLYWAGLYAYVPTLVSYSGSLGASVVMIGSIGGAYGLLQMIMRIPIGILSDRLHKRKIFIQFGMLFIILSGIVFLLAGKPVDLWIARALSGVSASFWAIITVAYTAMYAENETGKAVGLLTAMTFSGQMAATLLGGWISEITNQTAPFWLTLFIGIAGFILSFFISDTKVSTRPIRMLDILGLFKYRFIWLYSLLGIAIQFVSYGSAYVFTPWVAEQLGAGDSELGVLIFIYTLPAIAAAVFSGSKLIRKIGWPKVLALSFLLTGLASLPIPYANSLGVLYVCQFISGAGRGIGFSVLLALVVEKASAEKKVTAAATYQAIYALGMVTGPVLTGLLSSHFEINVPYIVMALLCVIAAAMAYFINPESKHTISS